MRQAVIFLLVLAVLVLLAGCSEASPQHELKIFPVVLAVDQYYLESRNLEDAKFLLVGVSDFFEKEFAIRFEVADVVTWDAPELEPLPEGTLDFAGIQWLTETLRRSVNSPADGFVVGLTGQDLNQRNPGGSLVTRDGERYALVGADIPNPRNALIHEIAHLFGSKHPAEEWGWDYAEKYNSIMNPHQVFETDEFDPKNRVIIAEALLMSPVEGGA